MATPDLVIIGSMALDDVKTPFGEVKNALGGSASYASYAASFFSKPGIVSVIGNDFPQGHLQMLEKRGINLDGIEKIANGKTFRWNGLYEYDVNVAHTLKTELNVLADFKPKLPEHYKNSEFLFLGNVPPEEQLDVLSQMRTRPKLTVSDTMDFYIKSKREKVLEVVKKADIALMNDSEARMLFNTHNLIKAAREILKLDSEYAIIKKGEHGALLFTDHSHFSAPGYPLEDVVDPTGCGDCFAGALMGYFASHKEISEARFRKGIIYASVIASFNAEGFSLSRLQKLTMDEIEKRYGEMKKIVEF